MIFFTQLDISGLLQIILLIFSILLLFSAVMLLILVGIIEKRKTLLLEKCSKIDVYLTQIHNVLNEQLGFVEKVAKHEKERMRKLSKFDPNIISFFSKTMEERNAIWSSFIAAYNALEKLELLYLDIKHNNAYQQRKAYLNHFIIEVQRLKTDYNQEVDKINHYILCKNKIFGKRIARYQTVLQFDSEQD